MWPCNMCEREGKWVCFMRKFIWITFLVDRKLQFQEERKMGTIPVEEYVQCIGILFVPRKVFACFHAKFASGLPDYWNIHF